MGKIGFVGLGAMGKEIAINLCKAGYDLKVHDIREESTRPLKEMGAAVAESVEDVCRDSDVVFTSVPGPKEMRNIALGEGGLLNCMKRGGVWFDLTTNSPTLVREIAEKGADKDITLLDAPVSGKPSGARSGKLAIFVGGDPDVFENNKALLQAVGDKVMHVGPVGSGNTAKLVHNLVSLVTRLAITEGMTLGVKAGMDPLDLWHAVRQGVIGRARTFDVLAGPYLQDEYDPPGFALRLAYKDFNLAMQLAEELGVPMKQADAARKDYTEALERGWGDLDSRSPMKLQNERAGVTIKASPEDIQKVLERD